MGKKGRKREEKRRETKEGENWGSGFVDEILDTVRLGLFLIDPVYLFILL